MCSAFHDIERDGAIVVELAVGMLAPTLTVADGWRDQRKTITKSNTLGCFAVFLASYECNISVAKGKL